MIPPTEATIAQRRAQYQQQFGQVMAQQDLNDYLASIKARSDVKKLLSHTAAKAQ